MGVLYALDFDGVLCDSCGKSSLSALKAAKIRWPNLFVDVDVETEEWLIKCMKFGLWWKLDMRTFYLFDCCWKFGNPQFKNHQFTDALLRELAGRWGRNSFKKDTWIGNWIKSRSAEAASE